jgi:hypothetical protein
LSALHTTCHSDVGGGTLIASKTNADGNVIGLLQLSA